LTYRGARLFAKNQVNVEIFTTSAYGTIHVIEDIIALFTDPRMDLGYRVDDNFNFEAWLSLKTQILFAEFSNETTVLATLSNLLLAYS
jgi:hypothetical protein